MAEHYTPSKLAPLACSISDLVSAGTMSYIAYRDSETIKQSPLNMALISGVYLGNATNLASQYFNYSNINSFQKHMDKITAMTGRGVPPAAYTGYT